MDGSRKRPDRTFTIRQLCAEFGVTPRSLRFYEDKGLLNPARDGLNRVYAVRDRARLQLILRGKRVGFSLAEIRDMLDLYDRDDMHKTQMATSVAKSSPPGPLSTPSPRAKRTNAFTATGAPDCLAVSASSCSTV